MSEEETVSEAETTSVEDNAADDVVSADVEDAAVLIEFMAKSLVDKPDDVSVEIVEGDRSMIYELSVGEGDLGKVIGREGRTARAMRQILTSSTRDAQKRAILDIVE